MPVTTNEPRPPVESEAFTRHSELLSPITNLQIVAQFVMDTRPGAYVLGGARDAGFQGDGSSLFTIVKSPIEPYQPVLCKIGWGEFSKAGLEGSHHYSVDAKLECCTLPLFCLRQVDSYFADENLREKMSNDPAGYLTEHCLLSKQKGQVQIGKIADVNTPEFEQAMHLMLESRIAMTVGMDNWNAFLQKLPDSPELLQQLNNLTERWVGAAHNITQERRERGGLIQSSTETFTLMDTIADRFWGGNHGVDETAFAGLSVRDIRASLQSTYIFQRCVDIIGAMNIIQQYRENPFARVDRYQSAGQNIAAVFPLLQTEKSKV